MSRLIIKNLPDNIRESRLRELFTSQGGELTDMKLCYTKDRKFRKFAFIGFREDKDAQKAMKYLDKTFVDTSKIQVELCKNIGDKTIERPWSKYSKESTAYQRKMKKVEDRKKRIARLQGKTEIKEKRKIKKTNKLLEEIEEMSKDPEFQEFLLVHSKKSKKEVWANENVKKDSVKIEQKLKHSVKKKNLFEVNGRDDENKRKYETGVRKKTKRKSMKISKGKQVEMVTKEGEVSDSEGEVSEGEVSDSVLGSERNTCQLMMEDAKSDMDWLKSKVSEAKAESFLVSSYAISGTQEQSRYQNASIAEERDCKGKKEKKQKKPHTRIKITSKTLKLRGVPFKCTEEDIINFFKPSFIEDIRFMKSDKNKRTGYAYVDFQTINDVKEALKKDKKKIKNRFIELFVVERNSDEKNDEKDKRWLQKVKNDDKEEEDLSDTGRIFIRNLSYTCTEADLENLFCKYGNLVEINLPIDKNSKKMTGYAFVTYMFPEHAIKAFTELDGTVFQGRILYLVPGKSKKSREGDNEEGWKSAYKRKKEAGQRQHSSSSHNWNALFLGLNPVADIMAERLNKTKRDILDGENSKSSTAVRLALGETELVSETRQFLESHGVKLDVFGQANCARSKNIILVKNLPTGTQSSEMKEIFKPYGDLGLVLMPPFGVTAIIEFINSAHAKNAFSNLAYSKFKHIPLYLEWAPANTLSGQVTSKPEKEEEKGRAAPSDLSEDDEENAGCTLFVKNLSFGTTEEKLKKWFTSCGKVSSVTIAKKKDPKKPVQLLSMGYGFVEYKKAASADKALKTLQEETQFKVEKWKKERLNQNSILDGHNLELKKSHREKVRPRVSRKRAKEKEQVSTKIVVRNVPFETNEKEIRELFSTFGHIKSIRLPKKMAGTGKHRGFAFVDFTTKQEAQKAFKALCQSTHLYGRRLVLEWAEDDDSVAMLRHKTVEHFHEEPQLKREKKDLLSSLHKSADDEN